MPGGSELIFQLALTWNVTFQFFSNKTPALSLSNITKYWSQLPVIKTKYWYCLINERKTNYN